MEGARPRQGIRNPGPADAIAQGAVRRDQPGAREICLRAGWTGERQASAAAGRMHRRHQEGGARSDGACRPDQLVASSDKAVPLAKKPELGRTVVAQNRKARFNYFIEETFEA